MTPQALSDIRVVDLSRVLAGPYCTMLLADYGATVIKIEEPGSGDGTRGWGPPWVGDQSAYFLSVNRNKQSVTLNLKHAAGRVVLRQLVDSADILVENFKPGTMERLGLGYATLAAANPGLIYCAITGYGQTGPYRDRAGYDFIIQAQGGIMSVTGPTDGDPHKVGVAVTDITAGLFAANAILAALHARTHSGQGQYIDVALLDTQVAWLANVAHNYFATGQPPARYGNAHPSIVPYETFATRDGSLALGIGSDRQFRRFCELADCPELWDNDRYRRNAGRVAHRDTLVPLLRRVLAQRTTADWMGVLADAGIPVAPINSVAAALDDPQVRARGMVQPVAHPTLGDIDQLGPVAKLSRTPATITTAPPTLGADTDTVLQQLGYSAEKIAHLRAEAAI